MTMSFRDCSASARPPRAASDEEEELDLPPLDGALDEHERTSDEDGDDLGAEEREAGDDRPASDLDPGVTLDMVDESPALDGDAAQGAVDIGSIADALSIPDDGEPASDEAGLARDEEDESPFDAGASDDAGAGTGEDLSGFIDEGALPPLDAERGESDGSGADPFAGADADMPWDRGRWRPGSGLGADVPCWLAAVSATHVVAAGPAVLLLRDGARVAKGVAPDFDAVAVAAADEAIFAVARRGALLATMNGGDTWTTSEVPWPEASGSLAIAATPGRLWLCEGGALWSVRWGEGGRTEPPLPARNEGVRAMTAAGSTLVILAERGDDLVIERLRGDDEAPPAEAVPGAARAAIGDAVALAATDGGAAIALLSEGTLLVSRDAGRSYAKHRVGAALAVAFAGSGVGAPVLVLSSTRERGRDAKLCLAEVTARGALVRVAQLPGGAAGSRAALAWDAAREVLWVACSSGLCAFERSARH